MFKHFDFKFKLMNDNNYAKYEDGILSVDSNIINDYDVKNTTLFFLKSVNDIYCI